MSSFLLARWCGLLCLLCAAVQADRHRPYEFSFNIVDFQHRYEKKDAEGIVTGEYGFITADGVYHETGYATDRNGDFIITRMRNRRITSLKDAQEIFKDRPEAARKLVEAVAKACSGCKIPIKQNDEPSTTTTTTTTTTTAEATTRRTTEPSTKRTTTKAPDAMTRADASLVEKIRRLAKTTPRIPKKLPSDVDNPDEAAATDAGKDLRYRFNYTITSHGHHEDGYRSGRKDGAYRSQSENGIDTEVTYLSNEFGHQPNVTFVPRSNLTDQQHALKGYSFRWYWP